MGYNIFEVVKLKQSFRKNLKSFVATLGSAISNGDNISFADNDISYILRLQHERLNKKGLDMEYEVTDRDTSRSAIVISEWKDAMYESYVCNEQYNIRRKITKDGKKLFEDNKRSSIYATITDVISGVHPDDEVCSCPNCGSVSTVNQLQGGCPFCGTQYKMSDLFPKVTSYYFIEDVGLAGDEDKRDKRKFMIGAVIIVLLFSCIVDFFAFKDQYAQGEFNFGLLFAPLFLIPIGIAVGYFAYSFYLIFRTIVVGSRQSAGKWGAIGSRGRFEKNMKSIFPDFSFEYFTSKAISLIKTAVYAPDEKELLFYRGDALAPEFKDIIDMNYGAALGLADFKEEDGRVTVFTDAFFDVLYARNGKIKSGKEKYRVVFMRRTDIPVDMQFSMTKIQCPTCSGSFNAVQNRICPFCGHPYDIESQDWVLVDMHHK